MLLKRRIYTSLYFFLDKFVHQKRISFFLKKNLKIKLFFDVGSHLGSYSDIIIKIYPKANIFMFEPQRKIFDKIKVKYSENLNVNILNLALSNKQGNQKIYIDKFDVASTLSNRNLEDDLLLQRAKFFGEDPQKMIESVQNIETIKLDDFINERKLDLIDLVKIDTEGHEFEVLDGLKENIYKVKFILIEFQSNNIFKTYEPKKIDDFLKNNRFRCIKSFKFPFRPWEDRLYQRL